MSDAPAPVAEPIALASDQAAAVALAEKIARRFEGCRLAAYRDPVGIWTIGWGATMCNGRTVREGDTITQDQADRLLTRTLFTVAHEVDALIRVYLTVPQRAALYDVGFNARVGELAQSRLLRAVNAGDFAAAADEFLGWDHAGGRVLTGLTERCEVRRRVFSGEVAL